MTTSSPSFQPSCPSGGSWYACGNGAKFVGCCTTDPCNDNGCFQGNLRPASFLPSAYGSFADQQCNAGSWYTCVSGQSTFMGCCSVNPCTTTSCPQQSLQAGYLSNNTAQANVFDPQPPLTASTGAAPPSTSDANSNTTSSTPIGAIVGGAVGGVALILIVIVTFFILRRRRTQGQKHIDAAHLMGEASGHSSYTDYSPNLRDAKNPPRYSLLSSANRSTSAMNSPYQIHEAGSREISHFGSAPHSPALTFDRSSTSQSAVGLGVRSVRGNGEGMRAELDGQPGER